MGTRLRHVKVTTHVPSLIAFLLLLLCSISSLSAQVTEVDLPDHMVSSTHLPVSYMQQKWNTLYSKTDSAKSRYNAMTSSTLDRVLSIRKKDQPITVFGYFRMFGYGRNMTTPYPNLDPFAKAYGIGDGYREPTMSLNLIGRPNGRSSFGTELFFLNPYLGTGPTDNVFQTNLGLNFYGNFRTEIGSFGVRAGGIHWYNLSPFTVGVYQVLDRFSIFDRTPWEGVNNTDKYDAYYDSGSINVGDQRWNFQPFQGIILNGGKLPGNLNFDVFWGKTQPNGGLANGVLDPFETIINPTDAGNVPTYQGFAGDARLLPSYILGGKIGHTFGQQKNTISYNLIDSRTALDSLNISDSWRTYQVHSLSFDSKVKGLLFSGELGMGSFESPTYEKKWGEALMLRLKVPEEISFVPIDVQVYQISKDFYNENGEIATNGNRDIQAQFSSGAIIPGQNGVGSQITQVNQLAHNRRGINLNTGITLKDFKFNLGWGIAAEMEAQNTAVTFVHRINGLALSRIYNPFPANATSATNFGPYGRKFSFFRGAFEVVPTTDIDPATAGPLNRKFFTTIDIQAKYKTTVAQKPLYFFYLGTLGSASSKSELLPTLTEDGYLFTQYHEFDLYYELVDNFILTTYAGFEFAQGGTFTAWNTETSKPLDQRGTGLGIGFDWTIAKNSGLYFRYRWMDFEDLNFALDTFRGREFTIELKTFF